MLELLNILAIDIILAVVPKRPYKRYVSIRIFQSVEIFSAYPFGVIVNGMLSVGTFQKQLRQSLVNVVNDKPLVLAR